MKVVYGVSLLSMEHLAMTKSEYILAEALKKEFIWSKKFRQQGNGLYDVEVMGIISCFIYITIVL